MLCPALAACAAKSQPHLAAASGAGTPFAPCLCPPHAAVAAALVTAAGACSSKLGSDIDEAEAKEAVRILDESKSGYIQFSDFVEWYQGRRPRKEAKEAASAQQSQ